MKFSFWFVAGSQILHSPEMLETVEVETAAELFRVLFYPFIYNVTAKANQEIPIMVVTSPDNDVDVRAMAKAA